MSFASKDVPFTFDIVLAQNYAITVCFVNEHISMVFNSRRTISLAELKVTVQNKLCKTDVDIHHAEHYED
jgi:hypothetical protein